MNQRGFDFGSCLDHSFDRDCRKAVKVGVGVNLSSEVVAMVSRSSEAASVRDGSTAGLLLGHVCWSAAFGCVSSNRRTRSRRRGRVRVE